jgi:REP-associated tyrosine transposase
MSRSYNDRVHADPYLICVTHACEGNTMKQMTRAFHQLYYHYAWRTRGSARDIEGEFKEHPLRWIRDECSKYKGRCIEVNAMPDHAHLLVELPPDVAPATFIGKVKGGASFAANHFFEERKTNRRFYWQQGYGVVTLRKADVPQVVKYIRNQESLHQSRKLSKILETFELLVG